MRSWRTASGVRVFCSSAVVGKLLRDAQEARMNDIAIVDKRVTDDFIGYGFLRLAVRGGGQLDFRDEFNLSA